MNQLNVTSDQLPIVESGIILKKKILTIKTKNYLKRIRMFENKHKMRSKTFLKLFNTGKLGDDEDWFDWLFVFEAYNKSINQEKIIKGLSL